jgi:hypothetical protein
MSNRNRKAMFPGSRVRLVRTGMVPPSVSRLSRKCGILNICQSFRPPRTVTELALLVLLFCRYYLLMIQVSDRSVSTLGILLSPLEFAFWGAEMSTRSCARQRTLNQHLHSNEFCNKPSHLPVLSVARKTSLEVSGAVCRCQRNQLRPS